MNRQRFHPPREEGGRRSQSVAQGSRQSVEDSGDKNKNGDEPSPSLKPIFYKPSATNSNSNNFNRPSNSSKLFNKDFSNISLNSSGPKYDNSYGIMWRNKRISGIQKLTEDDDDLNYDDPVKMVLSKVQQPGVVTSVPKNDIVAFLREFKALECGCCNKLIGFQHRVTGAVLCDPGCQHGEEQLEQAVPQQPEMKRSANVPLTYGGGKLEQPKKPFIDADNISAPRAEEQSYRNVSTLHKGKDAPAGKTAGFKISVREDQEEEIDVVDTATAAPLRSRPQQQNERKTKREVDPENFEMVAAEAIRKDVNPFFVNLAPKVEPPASRGRGTGTSRAIEPPIEADEDYAYEKRAATAPQATAEVKKPAPAAAPPQPQATAEIKRTEQVPEARAPPRPVKKTVAPAEKPKFLWTSCTFSPTLENGAMVKTTFVWALNKYQVCCVDDEEELLKYQEKIQVYCKSSTPMSRKPVVGEMVFGAYGEDFYRGRVMAVGENSCHLVYVDFGDEDRECPLQTIVEGCGELMNVPVFSVTVELAGVPSAEGSMKDFKPPKRLNKYVFGAMQLEINGPFEVTDASSYKATLWASDTLPLNRMMLDCIEEWKAAAPSK